MSATIYNPFSLRRTMADELRDNPPTPDPVEQAHEHVHFHDHGAAGQHAHSHRHADPHSGHAHSALTERPMLPRWWRR